MTERGTIWVVDDDESIRWVTRRALEQAGFDVRLFAEAGSVLSSLERGPVPRVLVTDVRLPGTDGLGLLARIRQHQPALPVLVITAHSDLKSAVDAYQAGAFEYLPKPFDVDELVELVERAARQQQTRFQTPPSTGLGEAAALIGEAPAMQEVFRTIGRLSRSSITVLITGESGTGKELVARALHQHSPRAAEPFVALNTAAVPAELLESELFGHERGAFTGATARRVGRFEQAAGGALFLDEIGDMPAALQTRLLRVLAESEFYRVGGHHPVKADVRIIAATHQDLEARVAAGEFREDLYHRLNVMRIHVPALRERPEDVPILAEHFLAVAASELGVVPKKLTTGALQKLTGRKWPGNVRELRNVCRRLTAMASGQEIRPRDLPADILRPVGRSASASWEKGLRSWADRQLAAGTPTPLLENLQPAFERILIEAALARTHGARQEAARLLGWGRNTLTRKIKQYGLD